MVARTSFFSDPDMHRLEALAASGRGALPSPDGGNWGRGDVARMPELSAETLAADSSVPGDLPEALYFGNPTQPLMGWWHASPRSASMAAVLCAPFGLEDLSAYRSLRYLAQSLAKAGIPALRFDYAGCGDSAGDSDEGDQVPAWLESIGAAINLAKSLSGAQRVALIGVRLGALLATNASVGRDDVSCFVAIAPPASGRAFVRECRMLGAAAGVDAVRQDGGTQAAGFVLSGPTCESLSRLTLPKAGTTQFPTVLVIDRDDMPPSPWTQQLGQAGSQVEQAILPGFAAMVDSPHHAVTPIAMMAKVVDWLGQRPPDDRSSQPSTAAATPAASKDAVFTLDNGHQIRERAVRIASRPVLVAQLVEAIQPSPTMPTKDQRALLILNTGSERRIGPNRLWVSFARQRASQGEIVLRLDQAGVGESDLRVGSRENDVYCEAVKQDVEAAVSWLRTHAQAKHITVMGICSGAFHGFQAALSGMSLERIVLINPLLFYWHPNISLRDTATHPGGQLEHMANAMRGMHNPQKWLRLLRGQIDVSGLIRVIWARNLRKLKLQFRSACRSLGWPLVQDLGSDLQTIVRRGISVRFVFSNGDPGQTILREEAGRVRRELLRNRSMTVNLIENADHTFTAAHTRTRLHEQLHLILNDA